MSYLVFSDQALTSNFHGAEVFVTTRNVPNRIPENQAESIGRNVHLTAHRLEEIRKILGNNSISINSWYRSPELNKLVGGSKNSDHMQGAAVDFICPKFGTPYQVCKKLLENEHIGWKQLIYEHTWTHISFDFSIPYIAPKLQVLTLLSSGKYAVGITDKNGVKL